MIKNYSDHAANERTFLAWVRTGVSLMALGILIDKFHIFLQQFQTVEAGLPNPPRQDIAFEAVGLAMVCIGVATVITAISRFLSIRREIEAQEAHSFHGAAVTVGAAAVLTAFGVFLILYLLRIV